MLWTLVKIGLRQAIVRRKKLIPHAISLATVLLLLLVPGFRQGLNASIVSWKRVLLFSRGAPSTPPVAFDSSLARLADEAQERLDGKALAFAATRLTNPSSSARAANQAVALDPSLTWVYYVVGLKYAEIANTEGWAGKLQAWDPQNGAVFLAGLFPRPRPEELQSAIARAAQSNRFDDYLSRQLDLDREVVRQFGLLDPLIFVVGFPDIRVPHSAWAFAQGPGLQRNLVPETSALMTYLRDHQSPPPVWTDPSLRTRIHIIHVAGLLMPGFATLLLVGALLRRHGHAAGLAGAAGLFGAAATLCFLYLPYAQAFSTLIFEGNSAQLENVRAFYRLSYLLPDRVMYELMKTALWWTAIVLVCVSLIVHVGIGFAEIRREKAN